METSDAVAKIAEAYADAEAAAAKARKAFSGCSDAWDALQANGVIGYLETNKRRSRLRALVAQFEADLFALHADDTAKADEIGVDLPQPRSGGGR